MEIICSKKKLEDNINIVNKAVSTKSTLKILECILLKAETAYSFTLVANDLELAIESAEIDAEILQTGSIAVDAKMLGDIVRKMPGDEIRIKTMDNKIVNFKSGRAEIKILGSDPLEFPYLPEIERQSGYTMKATMFRDMIRQTIFAAGAEDNSKVIFKGELIEIGNNEINMTAVDGFRIATIRRPIENAQDKLDVIVPAKSLGELAKIIQPESDTDIHMYVTDKHVLFELATCVVVSRVIDGEFLRYEQSFAGDYKTKLNCDRQQFNFALERACLVAKEAKKYPVKLEIKENSIIITSNTDMGTVYDEIQVEMDGPALEIAFNPRYLMEALKVIEDKNINVQLASPLSPCVITSCESEGFRYLVLPLRLKS